jgi:hypothetical protein
MLSKTSMALLFLLEGTWFTHCSPSYLADSMEGSIVNLPALVQLRKEFGVSI